MSQMEILTGIMNFYSSWGAWPFALSPMIRHWMHELKKVDLYDTLFEALAIEFCTN